MVFRPRFLRCNRYFVFPSALDQAPPLCHPRVLLTPVIGFLELLFGSVQEEGSEQAETSVQKSAFSDLRFKSPTVFLASCVTRRLGSVIRMQKEPDLTAEGVAQLMSLGSQEIGTVV